MKKRHVAIDPNIQNFEYYYAKYLKGSIKDLEKFLKEAKWNQSGEYQQIVIHEQKGDQIILADDSGRHDSITVSDIGRLLDGVTLEDTDKNLEMFWTNFQDVIS